MKVSSPNRSNVRSEPTQLRLDDGVVAAEVAAAPTPAAAWRALGVPGEKPPKGAYDEATRARLVAALDRVLAASDAIVRGVGHFAALADGAPIPEGWVDRMRELHLAEIAAWWALDDEAAAGATAGGWTVTQPHAVGTPAERRRIRARWQVEMMKPAAPALWWDTLTGALERAATADAVEAAGRALVDAAVARRFAGWRTTTESAGG